MSILILAICIYITVCAWIAIAYGIGAKRFSYYPLFLISLGYFLLCLGGLIRLGGDTILSGFPIAMGVIIIARFYTHGNYSNVMEDKKIRHKDLLFFRTPKT